MAQQTELLERHGLGGWRSHKRKELQVSLGMEKRSGDWGLCSSDTSVSLSGICRVCKVDLEINLHLCRALRMK